MTETEAPAGFVIKDADTVVNVEDFGTDHAVTKTIVNPKEETTTTTTTTTTSTTSTEAPTTVTTTTEAPTTVTTTTEGPSTVVTTENTTTTEEKPELPNTGTTNYNLLVVIASVLLVGAYAIVRKEVK